jgi:hypothetical protein
MDQIRDEKRGRTMLWDGGHEDNGINKWHSRREGRPRFALGICLTLVVDINCDLLTEVLLAICHDRGNAVFKSLTSSKLDIACAWHLEHGRLAQ